MKKIIASVLWVIGGLIGSYVTNEIVFLYLNTPSVGINSLAALMPAIGRSVFLGFCVYRAYSILFKGTPNFFIPQDLIKPISISVLIYVVLTIGVKVYNSSTHNGSVTNTGKSPHFQSSPPLETESKFKFKKTSGARVMIDSPNYSFKEIEVKDGISTFLNTKSIEDNPQGIKSVDVITVTDFERQTSDGLKYNDTNQHVNIKCNILEVNFYLISYYNYKGDVVRQVFSDDWEVLENNNSGLMRIRNLVCK